MIKTNPYSEALSSALQAVSGISSPDYILVPIEPSAEMLLAGVGSGAQTMEQAHAIYTSMLLEWAAGLPTK